MNVPHNHSLRDSLCNSAPSSLTGHGPFFLFFPRAGPWNNGLNVAIVMLCFQCKLSEAKNTQTAPTPMLPTASADVLSQDIVCVTSSSVLVPGVALESLEKAAPVASVLFLGSRPVSFHLLVKATAQTKFYGTFFLQMPARIGRLFASAS